MFAIFLTLYWKSVLLLNAFVDGKEFKINIFFKLLFQELGLNESLFSENKEKYVEECCFV